MSCLACLLLLSGTIQAQQLTLLPGQNRSTAGSAELPVKKVLAFPFKDIDRFPVITAVALSADGTKVYTGGDDRQIYIWDTKTLTPERHFVAHEDWIRSISIYAPSQEIATVDQLGTAKIWKTSDFSPVRTLSEKVSGAQAIAYSPNGKVLAVSGFSAEVVLFDAKTGKLLGKWSAPSTNVKTVAFSPRGEYLAAGGRNGTVRIWDTASGQVLYNLAAGTKRIHAIAFNSDGSSMAAGSEDGNITIWNTQTGKKTATLSLEAGKVFSLVYCTNNYLASGDSYNLIRLWNLQTGKEIAHASGHTGTIATMLYDQNQKELVSGSFDTTVRYWNLGIIK